MTRLLVLLSLTCLLGGCHFSRLRVNIPDFYAKAELVEAGVTKGSELEKIFGTPAFQTIKLDDGGTMHVFIFGDTKTEAFNIILFSVGESNSGLDTGVFIEDQNGVVEEKIIGQNSRDLPWDFWAFKD